MFLRQLLLCFVLNPLIILSINRDIHCQEPDTLVQRLIEELSDSLYTSSIQSLQGFNTRYELSDSVGPAGQWIYDQFIDMGYTDVEFDSFSWIPYVVDTTIVSRNIIATKPGNSGSDSLIILGGHYDSKNDMLSNEDPNAPAPGANDNASGTAGVLEIARLLEPYSFEKTIVFACFAGEEVGYGGSFHYLSVIEQQGVPLRFALILDMIAYQGHYYPSDFIIDTEIDYVDDALRTAQLAWTYSLRLNPRLTFGYFGSDHWVLGLSGGPSILLIEETVYPYSHSEWDVLDSLDIPYATEITKLALASVVDVAKFVTVGIETSDRDGMIAIPKAFALRQNYPNPFNPSTTIQYEIPVGNGTLPVKIFVYDVRGRLISKLVDEEKAPGRYQVHWDGRNDRGEAVSSGIYLYTLTAGGERFTRKMTVLK